MKLAFIAVLASISSSLSFADTKDMPAKQYDRDACKSAIVDLDGYSNDAGMAFQKMRDSGTMTDAQFKSVQDKMKAAETAQLHAWGVCGIWDQ